MNAPDNSFSCINNKYYFTILCYAIVTMNLKFDWVSPDKLEMINNTVYVFTWCQSQVINARH
jgi:hypothetical protein